MGIKEQEALDRWLDGEGEWTPALEAAMAADSEARAYADAVQQMRTGIHQQREAAPRIEDAQFRVFMEGIRTEMEPRRGWQMGRLWAVFSAAAACFIISASMFYVFWGKTETVRAADVEEVRTEIDGATTDVYENADGTTTIWVNYKGDDL